MAKQVILFILLLLVVLIASEQNKPATTNYKSAYNYAEQLYNSGTANEQSDSLAIVNYHKVIVLLTKSKANDSVLFDSYVKAAILEMMHKHSAVSLADFLASIKMAEKKRSISDSSLFKSYLYTGSIYYSLFNFDSALYYYKRAEVIVNAYPFISESERLYNMLGVLYFETGDYKKSILYFEKALSLIEKQQPPPVYFIVTYKNNIASAFRKLRRYPEALTIYKSLLPYHSNTKELLYNIGVTYLDAGEAKRAIKYLKQVQYNSQLKYNDLARASIYLEQYDSATYFLQQAFNINQTKFHGQKNLDFGITLKYQGDMLMKKHFTTQAIATYQQAIIQVDPAFSDTIVDHNPGSFYGLHNSFMLFDVLKAKANAFVTKYSETNNVQDLKNAFATFSSALTLGAHVEKMYHSDEAKLFLEQNVSSAYKEAVKTGLQLYELTKISMYLSAAFSLAENSKASVLQNDLHDLELNEISNVPAGLVKEQNTLQANISKLYLQVSQTADSTRLQNLQNNLRDQEIRLSLLQDKLDAEPGYYRLKFNNKQINVDSIQQKILRKDDALISYYYVDNKLICFYITQSKFGYASSSIQEELFHNILIFRKQLNAPEAADRKLTGAVAGALYQQLLAPIADNIKDKKHLLVIPYNELSYLPFEALTPPKENKPLLYKFSISYNYSANFLSTLNDARSNYEALAIAPFSKNNGVAALPQLAYSKEEVAGLKGIVLLDKEATKQQFIKLHDQYPVVHLATHAVVNDSLPLQSYIEFYSTPSANDTTHRLYEQEIYHLHMKKAQLVILSACETGNGQLINEEGIISLSRAFSYAGCKSVITSLWKADDAATAFIISKMHVYLKKGFTKDEALQKAKIDYLENKEIDSRYKTPAYWAHLVLIGNSSAIVSRDYTLYLLTGILIIILTMLVIKRSRTK